MRKIFLTLLCLAALASLTACGGGSSSTSVPNPPSSGNNAGFSTASLKGTYVFSADGADSTRSTATVGVFTADGSGNITSGMRDTVTDSGAQTLSEALTGSYSVNQDGRGQVVLNGASGQLIYRFVMQSPASAKLFQVSNTTDAVGHILLQSNVGSNILSNVATFITRFDGENSKKNPYGAIGALTNSGANLSGMLDENNAGNYTAQMSTTGTMTAPDANGRSTISLSTANGSHNLVLYWSSPTHFELISTDKSNFLYGYADAQTGIFGSTAAFKGDEVLNIGGYTNNGSIIETGRLTLDGAGNITNAIEDYNEAGYYYDSVLFGGSYSADNTGRWTASLAYSSSTMGLVGWQVSPTQSVVLTTENSILETGTLSAQTTGLNLANISGDYAEDLSGFYINSGNVELTGNVFSDANGNLNGTVDSQTPTSENTDIAQSGSYGAATNGRSSGVIGNVPVHTYTVNANTVFLISTDANRIYQGKLEKQSQ